MKMTARVRATFDYPFDFDITELETAEDGSDNATEVEKTRIEAAKHAAKNLAGEIKHQLAGSYDDVEVVVEHVSEK